MHAQPWDHCMISQQRLTAGLFTCQLACSDHVSDHLHCTLCNTIRLVLVDWTGCWICCKSHGRQWKNRDGVWAGGPPHVALQPRARRSTTCQTVVQMMSPETGENVQIGRGEGNLARPQGCSAWRSGQTTNSAR